MLWLLLLLAECALLSYGDRKLWGTYLTPLHFLMVPYLVVLLFTLCTAGHFGLERFYFPSLIPWIIGLSVFFAGSCVVYLLWGRKLAPVAPIDPISPISPIAPANPTPLPFLSGKGFRFSVLDLITVLLLIIIFGRFLYVLFTCDPDCALGSDCFGEKLGGRRIFSHSAVALMALLIIHIFTFDRPWDGKRIALIILSLLPLFFLQVKSWIILPVAAGFFARMACGKTRVTPKVFLWVTTIGIVAFFLSYFFIFLSGSDMFPKDTPLKEQTVAITKHCLHYITSGTMGLGIDMQQGVLEDKNPIYIFTPFVNLWHLITGQEFVSQQNPVYLFSGINYTNVRTFFGTLYVFCGTTGFVLLSLLAGFLSYLLLLFWKRVGNLTSLLWFAWGCTIMFIGWFNLYIQVSGTLEIFLWLLVFSLLDGFCKKTMGKEVAW